MLTKYLVGIKYTKKGNEVKSIPTENVNDAMRLAHVASQHGHESITFYIDNDGLTTCIPFSDISDLYHSDNLAVDLKRVITQKSTK
jgi:hypothetical protein